MLHSICQPIWKTQQWPQDWKRSVFIPISKKGNAKECSNYCTIALISQASKLMLKVLKVRLQQYVKWELPDVQAGFIKGSGTRDQTANKCWIIEKAREFQKNSSVSLTALNPLTVWITTNCGKFFKQWEYLITLPAGQETTVRTGHGTMDWFQIWKGVCQGCILSPCLFNFYVGYIMRNEKSGWITSWSQDCQARYQQPQVGRWHLWQKEKRN